MMTTNEQTAMPITTTTEIVTQQNELNNNTVATPVLMWTDHELGSNVHTCQCETQLAVLGVLVGLLMMVLVLVTIGWVWTCWILKKSGAKMKTYSEQDRYRYIGLSQALPVPMHIILVTIV